MKKRMTVFVLVVAMLLGTAVPIFANEGTPRATTLDLVFAGSVAIWDAFNPTIVPTGQPEAPDTTPVAPEAPRPQWQAMNPTIVPTGEPAAVNAPPDVEQGAVETKP